MIFRISKFLGRCLYPSFILGAALSQCSAQPQAEVSSPANEFADGVVTYLDAATQQLADIRHAMDLTKMATVDEDRDLFDNVYRCLTECDAALVKLKHSSQSSFDGNKKKFEGTLQKLIKEIERAKGG